MAESWGVCRLGDAVQRETARVGIDPAPEVLSSTKHRGLVPSHTYFKGRQIFSDDLSTYRVVRPGWFAYATNHLAEGSIGLNNLGETGCVSPMYTVFSTRKHVDHEYLYHLLKSPELLNQYQLHEQASVDRRGSIRFSSFAEIPILLPPLEEQRRIAEILDTIDETIQATERVIAKLWQDWCGGTQAQHLDKRYCRCSLLDVVSLPSGQVDPRVEPWSSSILVAPDHHRYGDGCDWGVCLLDCLGFEQTNPGSHQRSTRGTDLSTAMSSTRRFVLELRKAVVHVRGLCSADMYPLSPRSTVWVSSVAFRSSLDSDSRDFGLVSVSARSSGRMKQQ